MRKISLILCAGFLGAVILVQNAGASEHPRASQQAQEVRERIQERRATHEAQLKERRAELIRMFWNRLVRRMEAAIERLERLISRIERRVAKLEAEGQDMSEVKSQVSDAKNKLNAAKEDLQETKDDLESVLSSNNPKEAFKKVREAVRGIVRQLVEVHRILVHVIGDIKGLRVGQGGSPTPTATP